MENVIVLYPSPGRGHLIAMVELGKLIHKVYLSFTIIIVVINTRKTLDASSAQYVVSSTAQYMADVNVNTPSITFHHLPPIPDVPSIPSPFDALYFIPRFNNPNLYQTLQAISQTSKIKALIIDIFCDAAFEVAADLSIPIYYFYTSSTNALAHSLYRPTLRKAIHEILKDFGNMIDVPGLPPIRASDMPKPLLDTGSKVYEDSLNASKHIVKSNGIIVNTFDLLERRAIRAISDGLCVPDGPPPPIFCIGPVISSSNEDGENQHECLSWLNLQPSKSVVFLCFGSLGLFSAKQLSEMAVGLENSGHRFLWVVRNPPPDNNKEPNLDELLPNGFLERTRDRGFVVKQWAPQVEILSHSSVGGFVTHCGWNSVLEAVCGGVPMVGWPLYAEQRMNKVNLVEEMKVALAVNESEDGSVSAAELERRVRELMESEAGKEVRERVSAMRDADVAAWKEGGSSRVALAKLAELWSTTRT